jgi:hypothetical protein
VASGRRGSCISETEFQPVCLSSFSSNEHLLTFAGQYAHVLQQEVADMKALLRTADPSLDIPFIVAVGGKRKNSLGTMSSEALIDNF